MSGQSASGFRTPVKQPSREVSLAISVAGLLIFFALALQTAIAKTPTADEGMHLLRAQVLRQTDELSLQGQHTPLSHWLIGTFFFTEPTAVDVEALPSWLILSPEHLVQEFLWNGQTNVSRLLLIGRLPVIFAGIFLGAMLTHWARLKSGTLGQIIVAVLFAFSPNLLAFTSLATTDLVAAATFIAALLATWHFWRRPTFVGWLFVALAIGLTISAKLTGLIILPITLLLSYVDRRDQPWWRPGLIWCSLLLGAGLVVWAAYGFELGTVNRLPLPVPAATLVNNFVEVQQHIERGHFAYLLGQRSNEGWWYYFGVTYLLKTPAITLVLLILTLVYLSLHRKWRQTVYFWLPAVILFAAASYSRLNIGYRHILPIVPLIWLLISETAPFWRQQRVYTLLLAFVLVIYAIITLRQSPHFLAYFNELIGGSIKGYLYLGDSNIDWGQDLKLLADFAEDITSDRLNVSYFGPSDPAYYGLEEPRLIDDDGKPIGFAPGNPAPGLYAISVNHLQGATEIEPNLFDWFRRKDPVDNLGYSILIFEVPSDRTGNWIGQCLDPVEAIDKISAEILVGSEEVRHVYFECRSTWVIPTGGNAGWYILPYDFDPAIISGNLAENLELVYADQPEFKLYYWDGPDDIVDKLVSQSGPIMTDDGKSIVTPAEAGDVVDFLGGLVNDPIWGSIWLTKKQVETPFSVLMHLYSEGDAPSVADGLGYQGIQWQDGDIFIQYHDFSDTQGDYLETGLYDYTTGERLLITDAGDSVRVYRPDDE